MMPQSLSRTAALLLESCSWVALMSSVPWEAGFPQRQVLRDMTSELPEEERAWLAPAPLEELAWLAPSPLGF